MVTTERGAPVARPDELIEFVATEGLSVGLRPSSSFVQGCVQADHVYDVIVGTCLRRDVYFVQRNTPATTGTK